MKKAIFKTGDKVRYKGNRKAESNTGPNSEMRPLIYPKMEAEITETHLPDKGLGEVMYQGEMINDQDCDGYNVYKNKYDRGAIIWPEYAKDWERVED